MIQCHALAKRYMTQDQRHVLHWHLDELTVARGEKILITGPSGCGKTSFLNLLAGLIRPDSGTITVNGTRIDQLPIAEADVFRGQHIGLIFQSFQLLSPLTVLENVLLGARYGRKWCEREARERADVLLTQVGLRDRQLWRPGRLSIGEQQRVAIVRAVINEPPVLLADEPTASLDARHAATVLDLLFDLCAAQETTLVVVSHDTSLAPRFDRRVDASGWLQEMTTEVPHV